MPEMAGEALLITQIELVSGIFGLLEQLQPGIALLQRQSNAVIAAADAILAELKTPERTVRPGMGLAGWLQSDCTGASSLFMAHHLVGYWGGTASRYDYPRDAGDFGRCLGLLSAVPALLLRVEDMADTGPEWALLAAVWADLTALHEAGEFAAVSGWIGRLNDRARHDPVR
jgi:hypothetical protein